MSSSGPKLLLVGCGKMGTALLRSISAANFVSEIVVIEPSPQPDDTKQISNLKWLSAATAIATPFMPDVVLIAVKPQMIADVLPPYKKYTSAVFLSIAAGMTLARLAEILGNASAAIVRTMPNLPASIGQGATVAVANKKVNSSQRDLCEKIMKAVGSAAWVDDEGLIDAVTALSGSGPAYVFALCEAMAKAGEGLGLAPETAARLARQTIIGSGALLKVSGDSASDLRRAVTSPKGTTEAALSVLQGGGALDNLMADTMAAAVARAKELAK